MILEKGYSTREIAAKVGCKSHTIIVRLKKKYEETGKIQNKPSSGHSHGHQYCWKCPKDPLQVAYVKPTVKFGGASEIKISEKDMLWKQVSKVWNETALEACSKLIKTMPG
ncbi:hypothetical protein RCL_jg28394.t1 [Rhizophagus clarus]|uniref:Uncharacterized protein n=1 Tax=Rhizophagus clarus TaxID=94130 RepID=A0A8H3M6J0_9GLOM|nr:hypothetical protein RCL_jg28394.t1 [Rhizophagus clarus]